MKAPKCRFCGGVHWGSEPHVGVVGKVGRGRAVVGDAEVGSMPDEGERHRMTDEELVEAIRALVDPVVPGKVGYDRNAAHKAYMREYMRRRRGKKGVDSE